MRSHLNFFWKAASCSSLPAQIACTPFPVLLSLSLSPAGDPTDNAVEFTRWLKDPATPSGCLSNLQFTVFGLGNTQYEHYNAMGKLTNSRLEALGQLDRQRTEQGV